LRWVWRECLDAEPWLRGAVREELKRRGVEAEDATRPGRYPPPADVRQVVKVGIA
jgi:hypothetical protein